MGTLAHVWGTYDFSTFLDRVDPMKPKINVFYFVSNSSETPPILKMAFAWIKKTGVMGSPPIQKSRKIISAPNVS